MQLFEDRVGRGRPLERPTVRVVGGDEVVDALHELLDAGERPTADGLVGDQAEKSFDLIEPGAVRRDEVHGPARMCSQPGLDLRVVVRGVVVRDAVDFERGRYSSLDLPQEGQVLLMTMPRFATGQHRAVEHVQRGEQRGCAVTLVVVGDALDVAEAHGQHGLCSLQGLALALLVHADDQRVVGRAQVQANDVAQLLDEERVVGQLEAFGAMGLQAEELEVARHAALGDASLGGHRAHAPVRRAVDRLGMQGGLDQLRHAFVVDGSRLARAHVVVQAGNAAIDKARSPLAHRGHAQLEPLGDVLVLFTARTVQNDARTHAQRRRQRAAASEGLKLRTLRVRQQKFGLRPACFHRGISGSKIPHWHARLMPVIYGTGH